MLKQRRKLPWNSKLYSNIVFTITNDRVVCGTQSIGYPNLHFGSLCEFLDLRQ